MLADLSHTSIDPGDPAFRPLLAELQGNILKSHGRNWSVFIFIRFKAADPAARGWVRDFARTYVTTALAQEEQSRAFRASNRPAMGGLFANFFLSAQGYLTLGFPIDRLPRDSQAWFNAGMQSRRGALPRPGHHDHLASRVPTAGRRHGLARQRRRDGTPAAVGGRAGAS